MTENHYTYDPDGIPQIMKGFNRRILFQLLVILPLVMFMIILIDENKTQNSVEPEAGLLAKILSMIMAMVFMIIVLYRQKGRIRNSYAHMELSLSAEGIEFSQEMFRPRFFRLSDITGIIVKHNGEVHILGPKRQRIVVSKYIRDYEGFLKQLQEIRPLEKMQVRSFIEKHYLLVSLFATCSFLAFFVPPQPIVFMPAMVILELLLAFGLWSTFKNARHLQASGPMMVYLVLIMGVVMVSAYFKLQQAD